MKSRKFTVATLLLIASVVTFSSFIYSSATDKGIITVIHSDHKKGIKIGTVIPFTVTVTNASWRPVRVTVKPECGCTTLNVKELSLNPLHKIEIPGTVNTMEMHPGIKKRGIFLMYEDRDSSWLGHADFQFTLK